MLTLNGSHLVFRELCSRVLSIVLLSLCVGACGPEEPATGGGNAFITMHPSTLTFVDIDPGATVGGTATIGRASTEAGVTLYSLYWGSEGYCEPVSRGHIIDIVRVNSLVHEIPIGTVPPVDAAKLLAFTKNIDGVLSDCAWVAVDNNRPLELPTEKAQAVFFQDTDGENGKVGGDIEIIQAADESSFDDYIIRWGDTNHCSIVTEPAIAVLPKASSNLTFTLAPGTVIPFGAVHLLVYTRNNDGEMPDCTGNAFTLIDDYLEVPPEPPTQTALSVTFEDTDGTDNLGGAITIFRANDETNIDSYVIRWAGSNHCGLPQAPIATLQKTGLNLLYNLPGGTPIPVGAEEIAVYAANVAGEAENCNAVYVALSNYITPDPLPPTDKAQDIVFTDSDDLDTIGGTISVQRAVFENDISHYVIRWGDGTGCSIPTGSLVAELAITGFNLSYNLPAGTVIPTGASELLAYTKNAVGEMDDCDNVGTDIVNTIATLPTLLASGVSFVDEDDGENIGGPISILRAADEANINEYVLRWGDASHCNIPGSSLITTVPKTGLNLLFSLPTGTPVPAGAETLLVYTANNVGEMSDCNNAYTSIVNDIAPDPAPPVDKALSVSFVDTDGSDTIGGSISVLRATDEATLTDYVIRWGGVDDCQIPGLDPIAVLPKTGLNVLFNLPSGTIIPTDATQLQVYTRNNHGEMADCDNVSTDIVNDIIPDPQPPVVKAQSVSFTDEDGGTTIGGNIFIVRALDETDISHYVIRWGDGIDCNIGSGSFVAEAAVTGGNITFVLPTGTVVPSGASQLLVYTKNAVGEMSDCDNVETGITDYVATVPLITAAAIDFTDTDDEETIGGDIIIYKASDEADITDYVIRWGGSDQCTLPGSPSIATFAKTGLNHQFSLPSGTVIPAGAEYFLVYTANAVGEMSDCDNVGVFITNDIAPDPVPPTAKAASVSFADIDGEDTIGGAINILRANDESTITEYVIRWGGADHCSLAGSPIATLSKTGLNLVFNLPVGTAAPVGAVEILVYTRNDAGEMADCDNVYVAISNYVEPDPEPPTEMAQSVAFTDVDGGTTIGGAITIEKAIFETGITQYVLHWGNGSGCNIASGSLITELGVTGSNLVYNLPNGTTIPSGASEILAYTKNAVGQMGDCLAVSTPISNYVATVPSVTPASISFVDGDETANISGTVTIGKASDESDITHYVLRWGNGNCNIAGGGYIAEFAVTGSDISYSLSAAIPAGATQLLAYSKNAVGEMVDCNNASHTIDNYELMPWVHIRQSSGGLCLVIAADGTDTAVQSCSIVNTKQQWRLYQSGGNYYIMSLDTSRGDPNGTCLWENSSASNDYEVADCVNGAPDKVLTISGGSGSSWPVVGNSGACMYRSSWRNSGEVYGRSCRSSSSYRWGFFIEGQGSGVDPSTIAQP